MVVERSNASVYLIIDTLELKVEGSNPGVIIYFREKVINAFGRELVRMRERINFVRACAVTTRFSEFD